MTTVASEPVKPRWRGVWHQIAAIAFSFLGLALLPLTDSRSERISVVVYTVGLTLMYSASAVYHRGHWAGPMRARLRRLDHAMIMVAIASTYTPVAVAGLSTHTARLLLGIVWPLAIVGVIVQLVWLDALRGLVAGLYIAIGWTAVAFIPALWRDLGATTCFLLLAGGVVYSVGAIVYATRRPDPAPAVFGFHEVFHALVIVAGLFFYAAIVTVLIG